MQSTIEQIAVTQSRSAKTNIDSGASQQTFNDTSNQLDESSTSQDPFTTSKAKRAAKAGKMDDSFHEVTNRRQKKQMEKKKE